MTMKPLKKYIGPILEQRAQPTLIALTYFYTYVNEHLKISKVSVKFSPSLHSSQSEAFFKKGPGQGEVVT